MVDEQNSDRRPRELALFAGAGGGILGGHLLGWRTVCAVECEAYARDVLIARQDDGLLAPFPIWDDVRTFDGRPWAGRVDVVSGGFPCQDVSQLGSWLGVSGRKSGLWREQARILGEVRPRFAFVENVAALTTRGLGVVLGDLAALGFDAEWDVFGAHHFGAHHKRDRVWILAHSARDRGEDSRLSERTGEGDTVPVDGDQDMAHSSCERRSTPHGTHRASAEVSVASVRGGRVCGGGLGPEDGWPAEPDVGRVAHGVAARVDRLHAIGNGQVPRVAVAAFRILRRRGGW